MGRSLSIITLVAVAANAVACGRIDFDSVPDASVDASVNAAADAVTAADIGCADGERDAFVQIVGSFHVAGCAGGWSEPGLRRAPTSCAGTGDDSNNPSGQGCAAANLCAGGWHICLADVEVERTVMPGTACSSVLDVAGFWVTQKSTANGIDCSTSGTNDLYGCGVAQGLKLSTCNTIDKQTIDHCSGLTDEWQCRSAPTAQPDDGDFELDLVRKLAPSGGGVLCCRDAT
jgi:hypothetical protein